MLKLLLDEYISPEVADGLRRNRSLVVYWMAEWENGNFLGQEDSACLLEAATERLTLVTYDHSPAAQNVGRRRAKAWRCNFRRRKDHLPGGHWRPGAGTDPVVQRNREMGLDGSCLLFAAVIPCASPVSPSRTASP